MHWLKKKVIDPLLALLQQGVSPDRLALCVAIGVAVGLIPILGVSTVLCTAIALLFHLNLPAIQLSQAVMAPLQLVLIVPFVRIGEWMMHAPPQPVSVSAGYALMKAGIWHAVVVLKDAILHAGVAWLVIAPVGTLALFTLLKPVFAKAARTISTPSLREKGSS